MGTWGKNTNEGVTEKDSIREAKEKVARKLC